MSALRRFLIVLLTVQTLSVKAQDMEWVFSTAGDSFERTTSIAHDQSDGAVYSAGLYNGESESAVLSVNAEIASVAIDLEGSGGTDGLLYKLSETGDLIWYVTCNGEGDDGFLTCAVGSDGTVIAGGYIQEDATLIYPGGELLVEVSDDNRLHALTVGFSSNGELLWYKVVEMAQTNSSIVDIVFGDGRFYELQVRTTSGPAASEVAFSNERQYVLTAYDAEGEEEWSNQMGAPDNTFHFSQLQTAHPRIDYFDGYLSVIGYFNSSEFFIDHSERTDSFDWSVDSGDDLFITLFDDQGQLYWAKTILQSFDSVYGFDVSLSCEGVYVTGTIHSTPFFPAYFPGGSVLNSGDHDDIFIARLNLETGNSDWASLLQLNGTQHEDISFAIDNDVNGNVIFAGKFKSTLALPSLGLSSASGTSSDAFIVALDATGTPLWGDVLSGNGNDVIFDLISISPDKVLVGGQGSSGFSVLSNTAMTTDQNAFTALITVPSNGEALCCSTPEPGTLSVIPEAECPGALVTFQNDDFSPGEVLQFSSNGTDFSDVADFTEVSLTISDPASGWYRIAIATPYCGTFYSAAVELVLEDHIPPALSCALPISGVIEIECGQPLPTLYSNCLATDECSSVSFSQSVPEGTVLAPGTHIIEVVAQDESGNTTEYDYSVEVVDTEGPELVCAENQSVNVTDECKYALEDFTGLVSAFDDCSEVTLYQIPEAGTLLEPGVHEITIEGWDGSGNLKSCSFELEVVDVYPPVLSCPENSVAELQDDCTYNLPSFISDDLILESCGQVLSFSQTPAPGTALSSGIHLIEVEVSDETGNSASCSFELEVVDQSNPQVICSLPSTIELTESCTYSVTDFTADCAATDNCTVSLMGQSPIPGTEWLPGTHTVSIVVQDAAGNSETMLYDIEVIDAVEPVVSCPGSFEAEVSAECNYVLPDFTDQVEVEDYCSSFTLEQTPLPGTILSTGVHEISFTVTSANGLSSNCSVQLSLTDITAPQIVCPSAFELQTDAECTAELPDFTSTVEILDNCSIAAIVQSPVAGTQLSQGTHSVTIEAEDIAGNASTCEFTITVVDDVAPELICTPPTVVELTGECTYVLPDFTAECAVLDNCSDVTVTQTPEAGSLLGFGPHEVEITLSDESGNATVGEFTIEVVDMSTPQLVCPGSIEGLSSGDCEHILPDLVGELEISGTCAEYTVVQSPVAGTALSIGEHEVILTAVFNNGMSSDCTVTYVVSPEPLPTLNCPSDLELEAEDNCLLAVPDFTDDILASESCGDVVIEQFPAPGELIGPGEYTVSLQVDDLNGNVDECAFTLTVLDETPPVLVCNWPEMTEEVTGCTYLIEDFTVFCNATDACGIADLTQTPEPGTPLSPGVHTITITAIDSNGLNTSISQSLEVIDNTAPDMLCENTIETCDPVVTFALPQAIDNCEIESIEQINTDFTSGATFPVGETQLIFQATDVYGNTATCSTEVVVHALPEGEFSQTDWELCANDEPVNLAAEMQTSDQVLEWDGLSEQGWFDPLQTGAGIFTVAATLSNGFCDAVKTADVTVFQLPEVTVLTEPEICGMNQTLQATTNATELWWSNDEDLLLLNGQATESITVSADFFGTHWVSLKATGEGGCVAHDTTWISFVEPPAALELGEPIELDAPRPVEVDAQFSDDAELSFSWITGSGALNTDEWPWTIDALSEGMHVLEVVQSHPPCPQQRDTLHIKVLDLLIPSGFSPNGDLVNDRFEIRGLERFADVKLQVFDRDGHSVYHSESYANDWGGLDQRGRLLPADTYYAVVTLDDRTIETYIVLRRE